MPITSTGAWTKNYEAIKRYWALRWSPVSSQPFGSIVDENGASLFYVNSFAYNALALPLNGISQSASSSGYADCLNLVLGGQQSSVTPSEDDYTIYGPIRNSDILEYRNVTNTPLNASQEEGYFLGGIRSSATIQNKSTSPITVYEWGLYTNIKSTITERIDSTAYAYRNVLLYRGVLSEPVTLGQWDTITITFVRYMKVAPQENGTTP